MGAVDQVVERALVDQPRNLRYISLDRRAPDPAQCVHTNAPNATADREAARSETTDSATIPCGRWRRSGNSRLAL